MIDIGRARASSSPDLPTSIPSNAERPDHSSSHLEGVATNVLVLLKLIHDHNEASTKDNDDRKVQRVAGMMTILDDVKTRIQKSQTIGKRKEAELRRCNTDLRRSDAPPRDKRTSEPIMDEKVKLRKELNASLAARKSLEIMCSSLGKEKEIMAMELARKVHELSGMEELINDLKVQNENLLAKVQTCASEHKGKKCGGGGEVQGNAALQERNKVLSEQLLKSLDRYRSLKRRLREAQEENAVIDGTMGEMGVDIAAGLDRIRSFLQRMATGNKQPTEAVEEEISALEHMFESFRIKVSKHGQKNSECIKTKSEIKATNPSVLA